MGCRCMGMKKVRVSMPLWARNRRRSSRPRPKSSSTSTPYIQKTLVAHGASGGGTIPGTSRSRSVYQRALRRRLATKRSSCSVWARPTAACRLVMR